jgi:hypothetical protein
VFGAAQVKVVATGVHGLVATCLFLFFLFVLSPLSYLSHLTFFSKQFLHKQLIDVSHFQISVVSTHLPLNSVTFSLCISI